VDEPRHTQCSYAMENVFDGQCVLRVCTASNRKGCSAFLHIDAWQATRRLQFWSVTTVSMWGDYSLSCLWPYMLMHQYCYKLDRVYLIPIAVNVCMITVLYDTILTYAVTCSTKALDEEPFVYSHKFGNKRFQMKDRFTAQLHTMIIIRRPMYDLSLNLIIHSPQ